MQQHISKTIPAVLVAPSVPQVAQPVPVARWQPPVIMPNIISKPVINYDTLDENSPMGKQPDSIKIKLKDNQLTILDYCNTLEKNANMQLQFDKNVSFNTNVVIIGEKVGGGKSATCLSVIANNPIINLSEKIQTVGQYITIYNKTSQDFLPINIIVVPHTIFRQWKEYIDKFIDLNKLSVLCISSPDHIPKDIKKIAKYQLILVSNTKYNLLASEISNGVKSYRISRLFIDEADSINIPNFRQIDACKYYFITASIDTLRNAKVKNNGMLKDILNNIRGCPDNIFRLIVAKNKDDFVEKSFSLPDPIICIITCKSPNSLNILYGIVSNDVIEMINAGDIQSIIEKYKVPMFNEGNVVTLICKNYINDLENKKIDLEAARRKSYYSEDYKRQAIGKLQEDIKELENKISGIESRVKDTSCPICLDEFKNKTLTSCCQNVFCFECISLILTQKNQCPMCRKQLKSIKDLIVIGEGKENKVSVQKEDELKDKPAAFEVYIQKLAASNPDFRLLVFSEYENTFSALPTILDKHNVNHSRLMGSSAHIDNVVKDFKAGHIKCLLLNARYFGSGLNMEFASNILIYHRMNPDLKKQVIGRAQRPGRTSPLEITELCYENEMNE